MFNSMLSLIAIFLVLYFERTFILGNSVGNHLLNFRQKIDF